jgi:Endopolygalacturonase
MDFEIIAVFNRSITIELNNENPYNSGVLYSVYVDDIQKKTTDLNVVSIDGLDPGTKYQISIEYDSERTTHEVTTKFETCLVNVEQFGAVGDGKHDNTSAIQAAISSCPEGGTIHIKNGVYLTTPIFLKSHITLWLDKGAVLLGDTSRDRYPILPGMVKNVNDTSLEKSIGSWEGNPLDSFASLITGIDVEDVDIIGNGVIDGNAEASDWWRDVRKKRIAWRPKTIFLNNCRNIRVQGIRIQNSPSWTIHPYYCENIGFYDMNVYNPDNSPNTDGFDPECCTDVSIVGVRISVGDDCIAVKSGKLYMGMYHYMRTENINVRNCYLERGHGAVTIGSEVSSGVSQLKVEKCIFSGTDRGLRIKSRRGRGKKSLIDDITFENIEMKDVQMPFTVNMFYFCDPDGHTDYVQDQNPRPVDDKTPRIGSIIVRDVTCTGVNAVFACLYALPEMPMEEACFDNIKVTFKDEKERTDVCPIMMDNFMTMNGKSLYIHNVKKVVVRNVTIKGCSENEPVMINVEEKDIEGLNFIG